MGPVNKIISNGNFDHLKLFYSVSYEMGIWYWVFGIGDHRLFIFYPNGTTRQKLLKRVVFKFCNETYVGFNSFVHVSILLIFDWQVSISKILL